MHPKLRNLLVDVVIGENHPDQLSIISKAKVRYGTNVHKGLPSLAGLMMRADLMVSGGGTTTWERMCLGLPAIVITIADNQVEINRALMAAGYIDLLGSKDEVSYESISEALISRLASPEVLIQMGARSQNLVRGPGFEAIYKCLNQMRKYAA